MLKTEFKITERRLGQGTFADVYLGEQCLPDGSTRPVAIKQFRTDNEAKLQQSEIEIMKHLEHENIVKLIAANIESTDKPFVVLEYCAGGDFRHMIKGKRLSEKWACKFLEQLVCGLGYLHSKHIIHRDLKPHNLLLSSDNPRLAVLKIADFGFARVIEKAMLAATICGSPLYMAPEVLRNEAYSTSADMWSAGIIFYEMLCGERPFEDVTTFVGLKGAITSQPIKFPRNVTITDDCKRVLTRLLQKDASKRIGTSDLIEWFKMRRDVPVADTVTDEISSDRRNSFNIPRSVPIPIAITSKMVPNYVGRLVGAQSAPVSLSTGTAGTTAPTGAGSVFMSITPSGKSEPKLGGATTAATSASGSVFAEMLSTSIGLFRDSFR